MASLHEGPADTSDDPEGFEPGEFKPIGTVAILVVFIVVTALLWLSVYFTLLSQGGTV